MALFLVENSGTHRSVGTGEDDDDDCDCDCDDDGDDDDEATTNKTDLKWIHDDDDDDDDGEDEDEFDDGEEVWLRRRALITGFSSVIIYFNLSMYLPNSKP